MTVHAAAPGPLHVRTVEIEDPGDLIATLPEAGISWVRRGEGMIAWGEVARLDTAGAERIDDAQHWWRLLCRHAIVSDSVRTRGTGLVAFGSFAFADSSEAGGALVVPRHIIGRRDGRAWFTTIATEDDAPASLDEALAAAVAPAPAGPVTLAHGDEPAWTSAVDAAVERIRDGELEKVVLARAVEARAEDPIDVRTVLARLADEYPMCWAFHIDGLVGATPELLARVDHGLVTSRVLAGTIRMTGDDMRDLARAGALARSSKDREEHEYAARSVTQVLARHCGSVNVPDEPFVLHLPNVMHLATDVTGVLSHNVDALELVAELHPSAAVCGTPTLAAARAIDELEGLDRGRYAGPVGWIDAGGDGEWCIGLRSAEVSREDPTRLRLFAGCGIVAASEPESEWAESEAKLEPMRRALGAEVAAEPGPEPEPEPVAVVAPEAVVEEEPAPAEQPASAEEPAAVEEPAPAEEPEVAPEPVAVDEALESDADKNESAEPEPEPEAEPQVVEEPPAASEPEPEPEPAPVRSRRSKLAPEVEFDVPAPAIASTARYDVGDDPAFPTLHLDDAAVGDIPTFAGASSPAQEPQGWDSAAWEERYASREAVWSASPNAQLVAEVAGTPAGRALDAGCGEGADAVYLATLGWEVTAIDIAPTAIARGRDRAERAGAEIAARIDWRVADATTADVRTASYDLVTTHYAHPDGGIEGLVGRLGALVAPGGILLVVGHDPSDPHTQEHPRLSSTAFSADKAAAGLDADEWTVEVAQVRARPSIDADGNPGIRRDAVLRARKG
ncbi:isochorismate synthase [Demequina mangrovi]|uniref:isochorismate synthase n=1 Tax=Demequina mangrovi TaxID=1043493 RepID=UPI00094446A2|nr:isochorismate synthase [Demequina mangrovi]